MIQDVAGGWGGGVFIGGATSHLLHEGVSEHLRSVGVGSKFHVNALSVSGARLFTPLGSGSTHIQASNYRAGFYAFMDSYFSCSQTSPPFHIVAWV